MQKTLTFHGKQELKDEYVARAIAHRKADEIVQGSYWDGSKGCCVGCLAHVDENTHKALLYQIGLPLFITKLADKIHENLADGEFQKWPEKFIKSIPVGVDLSDVFPKMMIYVLKDCRKYARPDGKKAVSNVIRAFEAQLRGDIKSLDEWEGLHDAAAAATTAAAAAAAAADADADAYAAYAAANAAAYAAAAAYATAYATASYATAAAAAYAAAAYAAADADAWLFSKQQTMKKYSNKFIELIKECN